MRDFLEMQLMHSNDIYLKFLDWFDNSFPTVQESLLAPSSILTPKDGQITPRGQEDQQKQQPSAAQMSYSERRQLMKQSQSKQKQTDPLK